MVALAEPLTCGNLTGALGKGETPGNGSAAEAQALSLLYDLARKGETA